MRRLPFELQRRIVGGTYHRRVDGADAWQRQEFAKTPRALQILADVRRRMPADWIAIDDDIDEWPAELVDHLVACDGFPGLSSPETQESLRMKLAVMHERR